jgi:hypothetical protein
MAVWLRLGNGTAVVIEKNIIGLVGIGIGGL